ncbi:MAG: extracellular solute-binding protein [Rhodocyclales bacterium]|nr:extracellular solute-binding protein [Rhodocyclales bacterium]
MSGSAVFLPQSIQSCADYTQPKCQILPLNPYNSGFWRRLTRAICIALSSSTQGLLIMFKANTTFLRRSSLLLTLLVPVSAAFAKTDLTLAHQLEGQHAKELQQLVSRFNESSKDVEVQLVKRAPNGKPSVLNLATRVDLAKYLNNPDAYVSVEKLLADNKVKFNPKGIAEPLRNAVTVNNQVQALPVAFTTPVLFWNKEIFKKAGLDPNKAPKTWEEMQDLSGKHELWP